MSFLSNLFGLFGRNSDPEDLRLLLYLRHKRLYDGFASKTNLSRMSQWKRLRYNLAVPVVNAASDFLAGKGIKVAVTDDDVATALCEEYWKQSGGDNAFLTKARAAVIKGDAVLMPGIREEDGQTYLKWLNPALCKPTFDSHDCDRIIRFEISYEVLEDGKKVVYKEVWHDGNIDIYNGRNLVETKTYDHALYGQVPVIWVRNDQVDDEPYGRSDLYNIVELVEQYDHLSQKENRQTDYYMAPNLKFKGVSKDQLSLTKGERTVYFLPEEGDASFIEWEGTPINVQESISKVKREIGVMSSTPEIVFQNYEGIQSDVSGIALRILYGPLLSKTSRKQSVWGACLAKAFQLCLLTDGVTDVEVEDIDVTFPDPLPANPKELWEVVSLKQAGGVSKRTSLEEAGYTKEQVDMIERENEEEQAGVQAQMLKSFNQGTTQTGLPYTQETKQQTKEEETTIKNDKAS